MYTRKAHTPESWQVILFISLVCGFLVGVRLFTINEIHLTLVQVYALFLALVFYFGILGLLVHLLLFPLWRFFRRWLPERWRRDRFPASGVIPSVFLVFVTADILRQAMFVTRTLPTSVVSLLLSSLGLIIVAVSVGLASHHVLVFIHRRISLSRFLIVLAIGGLFLPALVHRQIVAAPFERQREEFTHRPHLPMMAVAAAEIGRQLPPQTDPVILLGVDGATWNVLHPLMKMGRCPVMRRLQQDGVSATLGTMIPTLSPVIWTSMATGYLPAKHGIHHFARFHVPLLGVLPAKVRWPNHTLLKQTIRLLEHYRLITAELYTSQMRHKATFWEIASRFGVPVGIVNWWCSWPVSPVNGTIISERFSFSVGESILGAESERTAEIYPPQREAMYRPLMRPPEELTGRDIGRFMTVSDDDLAALWAEERKPWHFSNWFWFRTVHQSDRCLFQVARDILRRDQPFLFCLYHQAVDVVGHHYWHYLEPDAYPAQPRGDMDRFRNVIPASYEYEDEILGILLDEEQSRTVIIVSDHGMAPTGRLPKSADHVTGDPRGVFIASGRPFVRSSVVRDISVLDLSPILLALLELPIARDVDGRVPRDVLTDEFLMRHPLRSIATWDRESLDHDAGDAATSPTDDDLYQRLRGIGYLN